MQKPTSRPDFTQLRARLNVPRPGFPITPARTPASITPLPGPELGDRYDTGWARKPLARWSRIAAQETVGRAVVSGTCAPTVHNADRIDQLRSPVIFVANHHSHLDTSVLTQSLPRRFRHRLVVAGAADYFFDTRTRAAASAWAWGAIPMERKRISRRSALQAANLIEDNWSLIIFPEGGRSPDGWGQAHKGGAAYLAVRCNVAVVPVFIDGTEKVLPKGAKRIEPRRVHVSFSEPLWPEDQSIEGAEDSRRFAARIESALEMIADERRTDWYSAKKRFYSNDSPSMRGPELDSWRRDWASPSKLESRTESGEITDSGQGLFGRLKRSNRRQSRQW